MNATADKSMIYKFPAVNFTDCYQCLKNFPPLVCPCNPNAIVFLNGASFPLGIVQDFNLYVNDLLGSGT